MNPIGTFDEAHRKVLADIRRCLLRIQALSALPFETDEEGVGILQQLRGETYEDLNQVQHEHLIVRAAEWLIAEGKCPADTEWSWNPRQTGDHEEPDLRGTQGASILISAEITTSQNPVGEIDLRMRKTLAKLAKTEGTKYYFVRTEAMAQRANTKVSRAGWPITVVRLAV